MGKYKHEDYLKKEIMNQSRHLFIYGYNNEHRSNFLKNLESEYPIKMDFDEPAALYFDSLGLPKIDTDFKDKDSFIIRTVSREFLSFTIAAKILEKSMEFDIATLDNRLSRLIRIINRNKNRGYSEVESAEQLLREIKVSRDFYYENYINYVRGIIKGISMEEITVPFLQLEMFVRLYKSAMNMSSYFGIIFDKKCSLAISSIQAINSLISARINSNLSVKVAIEPNDWETYKDANGQYIDAVHDFGTVELDDSLKEHIKTLKRHF